MRTKIKNYFFNFVKIFLPLLIGGGLLWYIYKDIEFGRIREILNSEIRYGYLLFSLFFGLTANTLRGIRWELLITPLGYKPRKTILTLAVLGSYAVNLVLLRMGEFWRCGVVAKYEKEPFSKLFGTLLVDRLYDVFSIGCLLLLSFFLSSGFYFTVFNGREFGFFGITTGYAIGGGGAILLVIGLIWVLAKRFGHFSFFARIKTFFSNVIDGFRTIKTMEHKWRFLFYTAGIWFLYFLYFYVTFFAFDFTQSLSPALGLAVFVITAISIIIPVQGGFGTWHFAATLGLASLGIAHDDAAAFALIVHTTQTLWVALIGFGSVLCISVFFKPKEIEKGRKG